jgi:hypothetical protein
MPAIIPRYSREEFARRGQEIYERDILPKIAPGSDGRYVVVDIETGMWEIDANDFAASERLLSRKPDAQMWLVRVGHRGARTLRPVKP